MTEGIIKNLSKWEKQNNAFIMDYEDGCLLDNFVFDCKKGIAFIFENYVNPNQSCYHMYFFRTDSDGKLKRESDTEKYNECWNRFENLHDDFIS